MVTQTYLDMHMSFSTPHMGPKVKKQGTEGAKLRWTGMVESDEDDVVRRCCDFLRK